jgi:hypothetical protein
MADTLRLFSGAKTPLSLTFFSLEDACMRYLLAIYRRWYGLPFKSTRLHLDDLRAALAAALRDPAADASAAIRAFVAAAEKLPGVKDALTQSPLQADLRSALVDSLDGAAPLSLDARQRLAQLAADLTPAHTAIRRLVYDPGLTREKLPDLREQLARQAIRLPDDVNFEVNVIWSHMDAGLAQNSAWDAVNSVIFDALDQLAAIPLALRVLWKSFLAIKVESIEQIRRTLGGGSTAKGAAAELMIDPNIAFGQELFISESAGAEAATPVNATLFSDVRFPAIVPASRTVYEPLIVRLTSEQQAESIATAAVNVSFVQPDQPELVDVIVTAPGFEERFDLWRRTIVVYSDRDSQPAIFLLRSAELGPKRITVDFYHAERLIGSAAFETRVENATSAVERASPISPAVEIGGFLAQPPPPADLELRIVRGASENTLFFTLHSIRSGLGYHWTPLGETTLAVENPFAHLEHKFERLNDLAAQDVVGLDPGQVEDAVRKITAIGEELWEELLPENFKNEYWQRIKPLRDAGKLRSLLITSDEPWIPWELVKPFRIDPLTDEISEQDGFWAENFELCRWLAGRGPADRVDVAAARLVAPDLDLAYVEEEKRWFDQLAEKGIEVAPPLQTRQEVLQIADAGGVELLHFAAHGLFDPQNPNRSRVSLADDAGLTPEDLSGTALKGLRKSRPVIFMNACSLGSVGFALTKLGGWAPLWINDGRASAFIGALWEVNDQLAAEFTRHLYTHLFADKTLGQAVHAARLAVRAAQPANPTWLAYTLYGDPNGRVSVKTRS